MGETVDPRLARALNEQLAEWRAALRGGAERVGWKLGVGDRERIGGEIAVGHLTSATRLEPASTYFAGADRTDLRADAEIAVELGRDVDPASGASAVRDAIARYAAALEIVDLARLPNEPDSVVAANVFHRAVAFGPPRPALPGGGVAATLVVNGVRRASGRASGDLAEKLVAAARLLDAVGERPRRGDWIITGSVVQVPITAGDEVVADVGVLGAVSLSIAHSA